LVKTGGYGHFFSAALQPPTKARRWPFFELPPSGFCFMVPVLAMGQAWVHAAGVCIFRSFPMLGSTLRRFKADPDPKRKLGYMYLDYIHRSAPPEALAHSPSQMPLPSCAPISARDAQRQRRRRWWSGDEGARRTGPEAQVLRHVLWHALRNALRNCAASLACSSFTCRQEKAWGAVEHDACRDEHLYASVLRATGGLVLPMRGSSAAHDKAEDLKSERTRVYP